VRDRPRYSHHRRGCPILDPARDPFADTVLDYAYNLAASGALLIPDHIEYYDDKRNLVRTLVARSPTPAERRLLAAKRNDDGALAEALKSLLRRTSTASRKFVAG
jgi:hypothetical protein